MKSEQKEIILKLEAVEMLAAWFGAYGVASKVAEIKDMVLYEELW